MSEKKKNKNNIFLNKYNIETNDNVKKNTNENSRMNNRFFNEIGKNTMREKTENEEKKKGFNSTKELFPSLLNDYDLFMVSKINKKKQKDIISYKDIVMNKETYIKIETHDIESGWVSLFKDENNKIIKVYGKTTPECLEIERKAQEIKEKKEQDELSHFLRELEYERNLRKELFGDIQDFYEPLKDIFYTKEKDIIIYTTRDFNDSDTEGSNYDNQDNFDYMNDDNYIR